MSRWDEVGRSATVFIGWDRPTPFGRYKIKEREGWGAGWAGWGAGWARAAL